jgi:hypothetical protein
VLPVSTYRCSVTGQYHKGSRKSHWFFSRQADGPDRTEVTAMKRKVLLASRILLSIVAFVAAGSRTEGLSLMVQQISSVGARQWLGLMVGSIVASSPVIAPLSDRIALSLAYRTGPVVESRTDHAA